MALERRHARERARRLLTSHLSAEQQDELAQHGFFTVRAPSGRIFRIRRGYSRNIDLMDASGRRQATLCAHPGDLNLPEEDHMLAQALHLLYNEEQFTRIANWTLAA